MTDEVCVYAKVLWSTEEQWLDKEAVAKNACFREAGVEGGSSTPHDGLTVSSGVSPSCCATQELIRGGLLVSCG